MRYEPVFDDNLPMGFKANRVLSDGIREEYMLWRTLTKAGNVESVLVLCGFSHAKELSHRFERHDCRVTLDSLCNRDWYSHPDCEQFSDPLSSRHQCKG